MAQMPERNAISLGIASLEKMAAFVGGRSPFPRASLAPCRRGCARSCARAQQTTLQKSAERVVQLQMPPVPSRRSGRGGWAHIHQASECAQPRRAPIPSEGASTRKRHLSAAAAGWGPLGRWLYSPTRAVTSRRKESPQSPKTSPKAPACHPVVLGELPVRRSRTADKTRQPVVSHPPERRHSRSHRPWHERERRRP